MFLKGSEGLATIEDGVEREGKNVCLERASTISPGEVVSAGKLDVRTPVGANWRVKSQ